MTHRNTKETRTENAMTCKNLAALGIAVLALSACGGGGAGGKSATPPIESALGFDRAGVEARQRRIEASLGGCMRAQGFEYVAIEPGNHRAALTGKADLSEDDFSKQYGYGITTLFGQLRKTAVGPNEQIRSALSPANQSAYDLALLGDSGGTLFQAFQTGDFSRLGGCTKQATEAAYGGSSTLRDLQAALIDLDVRIENDPRMLVAIKNWSSCMKEKGFDVSRPEDIDSTLTNKLVAIVGPDAAAGAVTGALAPFDQKALEALQREEVALVAVDVACEEKHITSVEDKVRHEIEAAFRAQNSSLIQRVPK